MSAEWWRVLPVLATAVQRARSADDAISIAAKGLELQGLQVAVVERMTAPRFRWVSDGDHMQTLRNPTSPISNWLDESGRSGPFFMQQVSRDVPLGALVLPLFQRQQAWGLLLLLGPTLSMGDVPVFGMFAGVLGGALQLMDTTLRLERQSAELELVHELAVVGPRADAREVSTRALRSVCRSTQSQVASLHRYDPDQNEFVLVGDASGASVLASVGEQFRRLQLPLGPPFVFAPGRSAKLMSETREVRAEGFEHIAIVPLFIESQPVGMLVLGRTTEQPYTENELRGAEALGVQMASLLERARLYDEASRLYIDLKKSYDELARTQAELVRHERLAALGELAAVMAHEVRNPLGVIFNSLTTLKRLLRPSGDAEMLLNMVGEEADRLNRIVADLLDFARPYELSKKPIAIEPIIMSAIDAATKSVHVPQVKVDVDIPHDLPPFPVDAHFMRQGLVNLVVNGMQAMPKGGTVWVRARIENEWLVIDVRDEGVGFTARAAEKMFQPFFTTKATGTGLGLAVVKRIVDAHQGEVSARINADGRGTTFRCRFPNLADRDSSS